MGFKDQSAIHLLFKGCHIPIALLESIGRRESDFLLLKPGEGESVLLHHAQLISLQNPTELTSFDRLNDGFRLAVHHVVETT